MNKMSCHAMPVDIYHSTHQPALAPVQSCEVAKIVATSQWPREVPETGHSGSLVMASAMTRLFFLFLSSSSSIFILFIFYIINSNSFPFNFFLAFINFFPPLLLFFPSIHPQGNQREKNIY